VQDILLPIAHEILQQVEATEDLKFNHLDLDGVRFFKTHR
jgi:hypothetical protein